MGDMVTMTATGTAEGENILDETDTVYLLAEDADQPFPGFAEALVSAELDVEQSFELTVDEDFPVIDFAGKTVQVSVTVSDIKERILPDLDEEFAQGIGEGYESLEALREQIENELTDEFANTAEEQLRQSAMDSLMEGSTAVIAPVIIENEINYMMNEQAQTLARLNIRFDDYLRSVGSSELELREQLREEAITRIKCAVTLEKIGEIEGIEVTDEDVEERIQSIIEQNSDQYETAPEITEDTRFSVRRMMHSERVMERLVDIAKGEAPDLPKPAEQEDDEQAANEEPNKE